ncbi:MAG: outer membrane beta-barrel protein [Alphaproteobacteria bacterium]|nr:outer membrane beta-barrel protein [Alphaproteobacteria bacterium]
MSLFRMFAAAGIAALTMISAAGPSIAGPASGGYNWSGFYVGAVGSAGMFTVNEEDYWCFNACNAPTLQDWDASIGAQAGINWQNGNLVIGLVGDFNTGFSQEERVLFNTDPDGVIWKGEWNWYATVRAKAGMAVGNALVFATGGIAIVDVDYSARNFNNGSPPCSLVGDDCASVSDTKVGAALGAGAEFPLSDSITASFEYLYIGLPWDKDRYSTSTSTGTDDYVSWTTDAHLARIALDWHFH